MREIVLISLIGSDLENAGLIFMQDSSRICIVPARHFTPQPKCAIKVIVTSNTFFSILLRYACQFSSVLNPLKPSYQRGTFVSIFIEALE